MYFKRLGHSPLRQLTGTLLVVLGLLLAVGSALGNEEKQRAQIGLRLFRTMLAADQDLDRKIAADGALDIVLLYRDNRQLAEEFADALRISGRSGQQGLLKNYPIRVTITNDPELAAYNERVPAGIYLVQSLPNAALVRVIRYATARRRILFSPFAGDVEKGVLTGFIIGVRVLPYLNQYTLEKSGIQFKSLLLRVAKIYE